MMNLDFSKYQDKDYWFSECYGEFLEYFEWWLFVIFEWNSITFCTNRMAEIDSSLIAFSAI